MSPWWHGFLWGMVAGDLALPIAAFILIVVYRWWNDYNHEQIAKKTYLESHRIKLAEVKDNDCKIK